MSKFPRETFLIGLPAKLTRKTKFASLRRSRNLQSASLAILRLPAVELRAKHQRAPLRQRFEYIEYGRLRFVRHLVDFEFLKTDLAVQFWVVTAQGRHVRAVGQRRVDVLKNDGPPVGAVDGL